MTEHPTNADPSDPEPDDVVDDRIDQHRDEQQRRAADEPKRQDTPDRSVATEASSGPDRTPPDVKPD